MTADTNRDDAPRPEFTAQDTQRVSSSFGMKIAHASAPHPRSSEDGAPIAYAPSTAHRAVAHGAFARSTVHRALGGEVVA